MYKKYFRLCPDQSKYSSRIVLSYIPIVFGATENSTIRSTHPKTIPQNQLSEVDRMIRCGNMAIGISANERRTRTKTVGRQCIYLHIIILLFARPICIYVRNVAREE